MPEPIEKLVMPENLVMAKRLLTAYVGFILKGNTEFAHACKRELDRLQAYKREHDQIEMLKENLRKRGMTEIVIKIEEVHIHG